MSTFGAEKFTTRSREVVEAAQLAATTGGNTHTEPIHLLVALLKQEDGATRSLVQKAGIDPTVLLAQPSASSSSSRGRPAPPSSSPAAPRRSPACSPPRSTSPGR